MAYGQWTKCVQPADYSGPVPLTTGSILGTLALLAIPSVLLGDPGVMTAGVIAYGIAYCRWWLYGRLVCLGGNQCAIGLALAVYPPDKKTGFDREDTDYSVYMLLAPSTLNEDIQLAEQDAQGKLIARSTDPAFTTMMSSYSGMGFIAEPEPLSDIVSPEGPSPLEGTLPTWVANFVYSPGAVILDSNENVQTCNDTGPSGSSAPDWQTVIGQVTTDNIITWTCTGNYTVLTQAQLDALGLFNPQPWAASTFYNVSDLILDNNGYMQSCATAGTSGSSIPASFSSPLTETEVTVGSTVAEASPSTLTWVNAGIGATWQSSYNDSTSGWMNTSYPVGAMIIDSNGNMQACITGGNSGSVVPPWPAEPIDGFGATTTDGQVTWLTTPNPKWVANFPFVAGQQIIDSNGKTQRCTSPGMSGATEPVWNTVVPLTTTDNQAVWTCVGKFTNNIGTIEVEFEGGGMYDLYQALLIASPFAAAAAAVGWIPGGGWLLALLLSIIAAIIGGIGFAVGRDGGADADPNADDPAIGTIFPGQDVLVVMGTWIYDSAHAGWNELHPVLHCQKIASVPLGDLATGNPWVNLSQFSAANVMNTINQNIANQTGWCPLIQESIGEATLSNQQLPQNGWTTHPSIDGCTPPAPPPPPLQ